MSEKKELTIVLAIVAAVIGLMALFHTDFVWTIFPTKSEPHKLTVACYSGWVHDPVITLKQYDGRGALICENELSVVGGFEHQQLQEHALPELVGETFELCLDLGNRDHPASRVPSVRYDAQLRENGVLIYLYLSGHPEQYLYYPAEYIYFVSGDRRQVFSGLPEADKAYEETTSAPPLKRLPIFRFHRVEDGPFFVPQSFWKDSVWTTTWYVDVPG